MGRKRELAPEAMRDALAAVQRAFGSDVAWWVQDGTLLGAVRHGGPIPGDDDIDIGMHAADFSWSLLDRFLQEGIEIDDVRGATVEDMKIRLVYAGIVVDLFLAYPMGRHWVYWMKLNGCRLAARLTPFEIGQVEYLGLKVPAPDPAERCLEETYGPKWLIPTSDWKPHYDQPNLTPRGGPLENARYRWNRGRRTARSVRRVAANLVKGTLSGARRP